MSPKWSKTSNKKNKTNYTHKAFKHKPNLTLYVKHLCGSKLMRTLFYYMWKLLLLWLSSYLLFSSFNERWMDTTVQYIIECGRWRNIARRLRLCNLCNQNQTGDEYYYILECEFCNSFSKELFDIYFRKRPTALKFGQLM